MALRYGRSSKFLLAAFITFAILLKSFFPVHAHMAFTMTANSDQAIEQTKHEAKAKASKPVRVARGLAGQMGFRHGLHGGAHAPKPSAKPENEKALADLTIDGAPKSPSPAPDFGTIAHAHDPFFPSFELMAASMPQDYPDYFCSYCRALPPKLAFGIFHPPRSVIS